MAILTGDKILEEVKKGGIVIDPFDESCINPNSYNLKLNNKLIVYETNYDILDSHKENALKDPIIIDNDKGYVLNPGVLYLGSTVETTYTNKYVPKIDGRSSTARLGISIHLTAGFGDIGFNGTWTLEITVVHPIRIYPYDKIAQIYFETVEGDVMTFYHGKYNNQVDPTPSKLYLDK